MFDFFLLLIWEWTVQVFFVVYDYVRKADLISRTIGNQREIGVTTQCYFNFLFEKIWQHFFFQKRKRDYYISLQISLEFAFIYTKATIILKIFKTHNEIGNICIYVFWLKYNVFMVDYDYGLLYHLKIERKNRQKWWMQRPAKKHKLKRQNNDWKTQHFTTCHRIKIDEL